MTANIFEIKRFAVHDGDGIRTTVFLKGCPLKCVWCHNPEGILAKSEIAYYSHKCISCGECIKACAFNAHFIANGVHSFDRSKCVACGKCESVCLGNAITLYGKELTVDELVSILLKDKEFFDNSGGGVTLSGGECLTQIDFCIELFKKLKEKGVNTAIDTCGLVPTTVLDKIIPYTDSFLYDVKAFDNEVHKKCTGVGNKQILDNLLYLDKSGAKIEVRIPFVPGFNDSEINDIGRFLSKLKNLTKVRVLSYHNHAGSKYLALGRENTLPTRLPTKEEIEKAKTVLLDYGLKVEE